MKRLLAIAAAVTLSAGSAAFGQSQPTARQQPAASSTNPADPVICEKEADLGTRLASHKICHPRSEWDQMRRDDRSVTEHVQSQRSMNQNGH